MKKVYTTQETGKGIKLLQLIFFIVLLVGVAGVSGGMGGEPLIWISLIALFLLRCVKWWQHE